MKVLHLSDRLSERGGADWHLLGVLSDLSGDCELLLCAGRDDGTARSPCAIEVLRPLSANADAPVEADLDRVCEAFAPDVIHVHNAMNPRALRWAADRGAVMTVQDHRSFCPGRGKLTLSGQVCREPMSRSRCAACFDDERYFAEILERTERRLEAVRRMRAITVLSDYMKGELSDAGVAAERISVIPPFAHGLDASAEPDGPPCVLFAGRVVPAKGAVDAVEAWRRSRVELPLVVAGTGSGRASLEREGVEVLGWVPHSQLSRLYRRARAVVLPSRWQEPFGIVGLEALTMGVPVAAWQSGGVAQWHPGDYLVPWGDIDALARALAEAVDDRSTPPPGFDQQTLMAKLRTVYRSV